MVSEHGSPLGMDGQCVGHVHVICTRVKNSCDICACCICMVSVMVVMMSPCERGCFCYEVCHHECMIGYMLFMLAYCQVYIGMVVVSMHEVMVCVVDIVMHLGLDSS